MAHVQYMPGDPRLVDQLVYELKSKGIFDQFRKDCIADVDTRPAYQNLRQRVENSVSTFLARQCWQPDLNKNQLREKLRKHIFEGNYLEQGVERIVDQVVNPKVSTVFITKVEDVVYNYLGIARKKNPTSETSNGKIDLLPTDLEAVSPGSVKSNDGHNDSIEIRNDNKTDVGALKIKDDSTVYIDDVKDKMDVPETSVVSEMIIHDDELSNDKESIPLPAEEIRPEDIPPPEYSPPKIELENIELPKEQDVTTDIPLPDEIAKETSEQSFFKSIQSDDDDSSSDSSLRRNMSPLTPIRNFNNENSCDAQQAFENDFSSFKNEEKIEPSSFKFALDSKSAENCSDHKKPETKDSELSYQFNNHVNINNFATPVYEDSSNSHNLQIDYESDMNTRVTNMIETKSMDIDLNSEDIKKDKVIEEKRKSHKSSHRSRDSHKHSSSRDKKSDSKPSSSKDSSRHDKKSEKSKDETKHKSSDRDKDKSKDKYEKKDKDSRESSRHRSSHKSSHRDSKSHRSTSSSHRHSSDKKSSSSQKDKDKTSEKSSTSSKDKPRDSKSSSHTDKDRKSNSSSSSKNKQNDDKKDKEKKSKKETDDHYSLSGRGNPNRRSTDRDSNDGSSSSKGSHRPSGSQSSESKKETKESSSKSDNTTSSNSTSPSDKENIVHQLGTNANTLVQNKPIVRVDNHLEKAIASPPKLPFVPDITLRKPKIAANFEEAKKIMKMRKFLEEEQRRMNQEAALLLEFQANVRPSLSQVYSSIPGPELEFVCGASMSQTQYIIHNNENINETAKSQLTNLQAKYTESDKPIIIEDNSTVHTHNTDPVIKKECEDIICTSGTPIINNNQNEGETTEISIPFKSQKRENDIITATTTNTENIELNISVICEEISDETMEPSNKLKQENFRYFAEHEKYDAELEQAKFENFYKNYVMKNSVINKIYLINCNTYEENVVRDVAKSFGNYEIVNYQRNGHLKLPQTNKVKNVNLTTEVSLPMGYEENSLSPILSPDKSDCSFEIGSDYDDKLQDMVNNTSRREIMEIILGNLVDESPTKMPRIDYVMESNIDNASDNGLKRKIDIETTADNNNRSVLTPNKIRRLSSDQISSTTQDTEETTYDGRIANTRSKYLGKARRVGLPRPRRTELPNSPSSDKSVENYVQNTPAKTNGKLKAPRLMVQRYETSDLYKPKLHYLSRRNVS
ncbi:unnamed protein product [Leptidea sinapis]|uniref:BOD1/SHG1 domain-containing protein n=1 Tax=Leptidea sinapis TaxID=189913 RepID=A0A5E4PPB6_9NEOP|nr:unnamed protein product [Leptidea sinapis]